MAAISQAAEGAVEEAAAGSSLLSLPSSGSGAKGGPASAPALLSEDAVATVSFKAQAAQGSSSPAGGSGSGGAGISDAAWSAGEGGNSISAFRPDPAVERSN